MVNYLIRRIIYSIPLIFLISLISFTIITLPPGDAMTSRISTLVNKAGLTQDRARKLANQMRELYGLDEPFLKQYGLWMFGIISRGDFGYSFQYAEPVSNVIWGKLAWTVLIAGSCMLFSAVFGLIPGIYSATHQYTISDNVLTFLCFIGLSIPNFFFALIVVYLLIQFGAGNVGGLFSPDMIMNPWGWAKFVDFAKHFWVPVVVIGTAGTARNLRIMRGNLLDVIKKPYVQTARAKGLKERLVIYKHAVLNAIGPIVMSYGMALPYLVTGSMVTSMVLNLPTAGPMFLKAIKGQDMYLAGSFMLLIGTLTIVGNLLADIVLAWINPKITYE